MVVKNGQHLKSIAKATERHRHGVCYLRAISAALMHFEPSDRLRCDPVSRFGLRFEAIDPRLPPAGKRETHIPTWPVDSLHRIEFGFGLNSGHDPCARGPQRKNPAPWLPARGQAARREWRQTRAAPPRDLKTPVNRLFARSLSRNSRCWTAATDIHDGGWIFGLGVWREHPLILPPPKDDQPKKKKPKSLCVDRRPSLALRGSPGTSGPPCDLRLNRASRNMSRETTL